MLRLVEFQSTDKLTLPGLLYEPAKPTKKVILYLHGNGSTSVFYSVPRANILGEAFNEAGIAYFPFNNRGAHYIKTLKRNRGEENEERIEYGTAYELMKESIYDIDGAIEYLKGLGYEEFYLLGHSTGANKICVYDYYKKKNSVAKYIILSPGDDTGIFYKQIGSDKFEGILKKCKEMIDSGRGREIVPKEIVDYWFSYQSLYDTINPEGDYNSFPFMEAITNKRISKQKLFSQFTQIDRPTLVIMGELEEYVEEGAEKALEAMKEAVKDKHNFQFEFEEGADHSFTNKEHELAQIILNWLQ